MQALYKSRAPLWLPEKKMQPNKESKECWYRRPESLLAQNFAETLKTSNETKKKLEIPKKGLPETLETPSTVANFVVGGNPSYGIII